MTKFILIRGNKDSGKTTTAGLVYAELLNNCDDKHIFNGQETTINSLQYNNKTGALLDFTAILKVNNKSIGIISAGDIPKDLAIEINKMLNFGVNLILCCSRSRDVKGSSYRMIKDKFSEKLKILKEIWVAHSPNDIDKLQIKLKSVMELTKLIKDNLSLI